MLVLLLLLLVLALVSVLLFAVVTVSGLVAATTADCRK
jgi:hypothetical protein